jgi:hypothetical protein
LFLLFCPLIQQLRQILLLAAHALVDLDNYAPTLQPNFLAFIKVPFARPVHIPDKVATFVVDHDAFIESVVFEAAIFPSLLLPAEVVGK